MSDLSAFGTALENIGAGNVFITTSPTLADFTSPRSVSVVLYSEWNTLQIELSQDPTMLKVECGLLSHYLMGKRVLMGWNLKNFFAYTLAKTGVPFVFEGTIMDLEVLESYIGISGKCPDTFEDAYSRLKKITQHGSWKYLKNIAVRIYNPLISKVIPEIEAVGVVHQKLRKKLHPYYEIAGQANGRMKCSKGYANGLNAHSTFEEERQALRPPFFDHIFMYLDYHHMEVSTLQWLSGDEVLGAIIDSGEDLYNVIWKTITGMDANEKFRAMCKSTFLPVVYGLGVDSLAEKIKVSTSLARNLIQKINDRFPTSMAWVKSCQERIGNDGRAADVYGRCRKFEEAQYRARNFVVQSPAALLCLDKLVDLHRDVRGHAKVIFHIHDGYVLSCHRTDRSRVQDIAVKSLERESDLFPGLKLKVSCKFGNTFEGF